MNIVFLDADTLGSDISFLELEGLGDLTCFSHTHTEQVVERSRDADIIITNKVKITKDILDKLPNLKLICEAATGVDNIDVLYANEKNIIVKNVVGYSTASVVQHTFSLVLYLLNDLTYYRDYTKNLNWETSETFSHFKSFLEISNKKWGIIGLGTIGKEVAKVAKAFGANVSYYSTSGKNRSADYTHKDLTDLLSSSDIISIHAPLNTDTKDLIGIKELLLMKEGSILVNLGRGGIINEDDLSQFLTDGTNCRFGLDVLSMEPMDKNLQLKSNLDDSKLIITPHIAWASKESRQRLMDQICLNIRTFSKK